MKYQNEDWTACQDIELLIFLTIADWYSRPLAVDCYVIAAGHEVSSDRDTTIIILDTMY